MTKTKPPKIKKPPNGVFAMYCYECKFWNYSHTSGGMNVGWCDVIPSEPEYDVDGYNKPCGCWERKKR
jgi:hypothetical protein